MGVGQGAATGSGVAHQQTADGGAQHVVPGRSKSERRQLPRIDRLARRDPLLDLRGGPPQDALRVCHAR